MGLDVHLDQLDHALGAGTAFSSTGVSCRHGPHQSAQKSTSTGWRFNSSMTSCTKVWVVVSLIRSAATGAGPPPCSTIVTVSSPDVLRRCLGITDLELEGVLEFGPVLARLVGEVPHPLDGGLVAKFNWQAPAASSETGWAGTPGRRCPVEASQGTFDCDCGVRKRIGRGTSAAGSKNGSNRPALRGRPDLGFPGLGLRGGRTAAF